MYSLWGATGIVFCVKWDKSNKSTQLHTPWLDNVAVAWPAYLWRYERQSWGRFLEQFKISLTQKFGTKLDKMKNKTARLERSYCQLSHFYLSQHAKCIKRVMPKCCRWLNRLVRLCESFFFYLQFKKCLILLSISFERLSVHGLIHTSRPALNDFIFFTNVGLGQGRDEFDTSPRGAIKLF